MYTKTGFSLLAAAGVAVGVVGMTMGGAQGASTACVPSGSSAQSASPSNAGAARTASTSNDSANNASNGGSNNASNSGTGAAGPAGPQGPAGSNGSDGSGTDPLGTLPGPSGPTGSNGLKGLNVDVHGDNEDAVTGSATATNSGSSVANTPGTRGRLLDIRARSNATNAPSSGATSGTHATARSSVTGPQPIVSLHPGS